MARRCGDPCASATPHLVRRVLFVTGDTLSAQARQVLEESGCPSLDKPFAKADLLVAVRATLER